MTSNAFSQVSELTEIQELDLPKNNLIQQSIDISWIEDYIQYNLSSQKNYSIINESHSNDLNLIDDGPGDGIEYKVCTGAFKLGCKDTKYTHDIAMLQECLEITVTGYFGRNTEKELKAFTSKTSITAGEIKAVICGDFSEIDIY